MTRIRYRELNNGCLFSCEGHAGYAPRGGDIVCAGISALCTALLRRLEEMSLTGMVRIARCDVTDGALELRVETDEDDKMSALLLNDTFAVVLAGLSALEEEYEDYVEIV